MENTINLRNNEKVIQKESPIIRKPELTVKGLGEKIINYIDDPENEFSESRLFQPKRQLINYLFNRIGCLSEIQLEEQLLSYPLDRDDNLTLYAFFLSQTEQFNFEWSYLLLKHKKISDFLRRFNLYINFICKDITEIIASIELEDQTFFQVDDFLHIGYSPKHNSLTAKIDLDQMRNILFCKADFYNLKVICRSKTIVSIYRSSREISKSVTDKIETMLTFIRNA